jgi:hypothetical protein
MPEGENAGCEEQQTPQDNDAHRTYSRAHIHSPELEHRFTYHAPKEGQPEKYEDIRERAKFLAYLISEDCPDCREKSLALTKLEEAVMWANAAIARNG